MYEELKGKKLLIIGADVGDMEIIRTAHALGIYVISVDWSTGENRRPAKRIADEAWDMDYRDLDALEERCRREHVDGIMAGYSETRVLMAARLSRRLGKPFYATEKLVEITRDKRSFKNLCKKYGIPTPREFCATGSLTEEDLAQVTYPVIVKPADYGGRFGISVCENKAELAAAVDKALSCSECKSVVVEEYIDGLEMGAIYNLADGEIALALVNDKYQMIRNGKTTFLCNATIVPSKHIAEYMETVDPYIKAFLKGIGAKNGIAAFQMIAGKDGIKVFEMSYRLNGGNDQHIIEKYNGINHMKMLISYSLTGSMGDDIHKNNPDFGEYATVLHIYCRGGTVGKAVCEMKPGENDILAITPKVFPGSVVRDEGTTQQDGIVVKARGGSLEEIAQKIKEIYNSVTIEDTQGRDMRLECFDTRRLFE